MKTFVLKKQQFIQRPLNDIFSFFERPENLARITPAHLGFQIITPSPIIMKKGAVIDYTIKVMGVRVGWQTVITNYEPGNMFVDEQAKGPYKHWRHTHTFSELLNGTLMTDEIEYSLPYGILGQLAHVLFVHTQLESIFDYRARTIHELFGNPEVEHANTWGRSDPMEAQL